MCIRDRASTICLMLDKKLPRREPYKNQIKFVVDRPGHDKRYAIDSKLIQKELGWRPKNTFNSGINKTLEWYMKNRSWCAKVANKANYDGNRIGILNKINESINL